MHKHSNAIYGGLDLCFGRDELCKDLVESALDSGAVLMFGGRQAGKSTILRKIERDLRKDLCSADDLRHLKVPVYADLMRLPYDATPVDFFRLLSNLALDACKQQIAGFGLQSLRTNVESERTLLDFFISDIQTIFEAAGNVNIHFLFLLDEAKRVLFDRFPRGFQDNLFALLFGETAVSSHCSLLFAGAQELYRFCEDETSPIGSRAEKHLIINLPVTAVVDMLLHGDPSLDLTAAQSRADMIFYETGGHAGLSAYLAFKLGFSTNGSAESLKSIVRNFQAQHSELFQIWTARFSPEAKLITDRLIIENDLELHEITRILNDNAMSSFRVDRVFEELQFTGVALRNGDRLCSVNRMYANVARNYVVKQAQNENERPVWALLEELELNLRRLVRLRFEERWPESVENQFARCLGEETWRKILENQSKYEESYPRSGKDAKLGILDFAYLAQLGQLMMWRTAWDMFKHMFRDKREFDDMLCDIYPVRNDSAHFRSVPKKELDRCRIRCEDLLTIVEKEIRLSVTATTF